MGLPPFRETAAAFCARKALPGALQVADRWPVMENVSAAFLKGLAQIDAPDNIGARRGVIDPTLLTAAERLQYEGCLRREEVNAAILDQAEAARRSRRLCGCRSSRGLIRKILRGRRSDIFRTRRVHWNCDFRGPRQADSGPPLFLAD